VLGEGNPCLLDSGVNHRGAVGDEPGKGGKDLEDEA
jgi:hypothetical protein